MGIGRAAQNAREGGREEARRRVVWRARGTPEHRASRRLTRTLLTLLLQQHLPDVDRAKADALGLKKKKKSRLFEASADLCPRNAYCKDYSSYFQKNGFLFG